jgi:hypothetical protein
MMEGQSAEGGADGPDGERYYNYVRLVHATDSGTEENYPVYLPLALEEGAIQNL